MSEGKFRTLAKIDDLDWCGFFNGKSKINAMIKIFLMLLQNSAPQLIKSCPYDGKVSSNLTFSRQLLLVFPDGRFLVKASLFDKDVKIPVLKFTVTFEKN